MEFSIDQESEILRNHKIHQKSLRKLFAVPLKSGEPTVKKFENFIDEDSKIIERYFPELTSWDENGTPPPDDNQTLLSDGADDAADGLETTGDTADATATVATDTPAATSANDDDNGSQRGDATAWTADISDDGEPQQDNELSTKTPVNNENDDDDDDDNDDDDDENFTEEKGPDSDSVLGAFNAVEHVETSIWETPSYDYSRDAKDSLVEVAERPVLTAPETFGVACVLDIWVDRMDLLDAMDGTEQLHDGDRPSTAADDHPETKSERQKVTKFLAFVRDTLRLTVRELLSYGTYDELRRVNEMMLMATREEQQLKADLMYNRDALNDLRATIKEQKKHYNTDKWRMQSKIFELRKQFNKTMKLIDLEGDYVQAWEAQCSDENNEILKDEANRLHQPLKPDYTSIARHVIYPELIATLGPILAKWEQMYDTQVGAIDVDTLTLENHEEEEIDSINKYQEICDGMQITINEFEERKNKYEERMRYEARRNKMATRIQAFWRGIMVRRCLGQYKYLRKLFRKKKNKQKKNKKK